MNIKLIQYLVQEYHELFIRGALTTLWISIIGTIVGLIIGILIGVVNTIPKQKKKITNIILETFKVILKVYIEVFRGTPMIVQAMIIYYGAPSILGLDLGKNTVAIFIVSINTGAYMAEVVRGGICSIDKGQFEAASAIGMNHWQTMTKIILPQTIKNILPATGNEFVINIKDTSVLNVIAVTELFYTTKTVGGTHAAFTEAFTITCVIYLFMTFVVTRILRYLERRMEGSGEFIMAGNQNQI